MEETPKTLLGNFRGFFGGLSGLLGVSAVVGALLSSTWVVVKTMVPFWVLNIIRHLVFRGPKRDHNFDNRPHDWRLMELAMFRNVESGI